MTLSTMFLSCKLLKLTEIVDFDFLIIFAISAASNTFFLYIDSIPFSEFFKKYLLNIQNSTWFFIGIILLILGSFVTIFDYPQIQYFENMDSKMYATLESEQKEIHNRLIIEFSIGLVILLAGGALFTMSFFRNSKK